MSCKSLDLFECSRLSLISVSVFSLKIPNTLISSLQYDTMGKSYASVASSRAMTSGNFYSELSFLSLWYPTIQLQDDSETYNWT